MNRFIIIFFCLILSASVFAQEEFEKVIKDNFRVNPLSGSFSAFLKAYTTDPDLLDKQIEKKTDTTLFFVKGRYEIFNPFKFKSKKVETYFVEKELTFEYDEKPYTIPYYVYQILVYTDDNVAYRNLIKKEYQKLNKKLKRDLSKVETISLKGVKNIEDGEITNFSNNVAIMEPATISWQTLSSSKQLVLTLMVRLQINKNELTPFGFDLNSSSSLSFSISSW